MLQKKKYKHSILSFADIAGLTLIFPWFFSIDHFLASYVSTTGDHISLKIFNSIVTGPLCLALTLLFLPFAIVGFFLLVFVRTFVESVPYRYRECSNIGASRTTPSGRFCIASANVCLLPDCLAKFNNNALSSLRSLRIAKTILGEGANICDLQEDDHVNAHFPDVDFLCLQEVWGQVTAWLLMYILKKRFAYFLYDVGKDGWNVNRYFLGSGLMFASRYPILDVDFKHFSTKTFQGKFTSIGLLQIKVELKDSPNKEVGYIATTHLQSYQGKLPCIFNELNECQHWLEDFRQTTADPDEIIAFSIFCGDFNFDNMSPSDIACTNHRLFDHYIDPCRIASGRDHNWTIGTEFRQLMLWDEKINSPEKLKAALKCPKMRRCYLLDANVYEHTMELAFLKPPYDEKGKLNPTSSGGKRRIDYILHHKNFPLDVQRFYFVTALTQMTDHLPVVMIFDRKKHIA